MFFPAVSIRFCFYSNYSLIHAKCYISRPVMKTGRIWMQKSKAWEAAAATTFCRQRRQRHQRHQATEASTHRTLRQQRHQAAQSTTHRFHRPCGKVAHMKKCHYHMTIHDISCLTELTWNWFRTQRDCLPMHRRIESHRHVSLLWVSLETRPGINLR